MLRGNVVDRAVGVVIDAAFGTVVTAFVTGLIFPVYKNFGFSLGAQDNYINNPPSGYKSNTFQFTAGLNYTFK